MQKFARTQRGTDEILERKEQQPIRLLLKAYTYEHAQALFIFVDNISHMHLDFV
jgi:hypothetical protein